MALTDEDPAPDLARFLTERRPVAQTPYEGIFLQSGMPQLFVTPDGVIAAVNAATCALFDRSPDELVGDMLLERLPAESHDADREVFEAVVTGRLERAQIERRLDHRDGRWLDTLVSVAGVRTASGALAGISLSLQDISGLRTAQRLAERERARWRSLSRNASDVAVITDAELVIDYVTPSMALLLGQPEHALLGTCLLQLVHSADRARVEAGVKRYVTEGTDEGVVEFRIRDASGGWRDVVQRTVNMLGDPHVAGLVLNLRDETERHALENDLRRAVLTDRLTGLSNRSLLMDRLEQAIERDRSTPRPYALLFVNMDRLRVINESHGQGVGNEVLQVVADRLSALVRPIDTVARYDGDQFAVLVDDAGDAGDVEALAWQIAANLDTDLQLGELTVSTSARVGVVHGPAASADWLVSAAESATAEAKALGRAQVHVLDPGARERLSNERALAAELRLAVAEHQLAVHYQPIVELATGAVVSLEALIRWPHPRLGLLRPDSFLSLAASLDLLDEIDDWVLAEACRDAGQWRAGGAHDVTVAVNVAPDRLTAPGFHERIEEVLVRTALPPSALTLEVTETAVVADVATAAEVLSALSGLGIGISIDDFGIGYSSMLQLRRLPFDKLKIDREFTRGLPDNADDVAICASVIGLANRLGVRTTAEGVEHPSQAAALIKLGCQYGQGFLWSSAVSAASVPELLAAPRWRPAGLAPALRMPTPQSLTTDPAILAHAHRMQDEGASLHTIAANLNQRGLRTSSGRRWQAATVARLLYR
jgi:diguanylate cyclase (GGDEF)-like protein/PAS domain S-box-containing protein